MPAYGVWAAAWMTVATEMVLATGLIAALFGAWRDGQRWLRESGHRVK